MEAIIAAVLTFLTALISAVIGYKKFLKQMDLKLKNQNKEILEGIPAKEDSDNVTITAINKKLEIISSDIEWLKEIHKYAQFGKALSTKLENTTDTLISIKEFKNEELIRGIFIGLNKFKNIYENILNNDFKIDNIKLKDFIYINLKSVKAAITFMNLNVKSPNEFLEKVENEILKKHVEAFIFEFSNTCKLKNGSRKQPFEDSCIKLVTNIVTDIIDNYNKLKIL